MKKITDRYKVLAQKSYGEYREKGSKFLAYAFPVTSIDEVEINLEEVRGLHPKATHHCYAYRLGIDGELYRANDDGEPSGTAGKPILGQLLSNQVSDTLVIVVRYYGGTKLGASGLIHAYKTAALASLEKASIKERVLSDTFELTFDYAEMGNVLNTLKSIDLEITKKEFLDVPKVEVEIPISETDKKLTRLKAKLLQVSLEQIDDDTQVPFCNIEKIIIDA